jgi:hypothetical protein
MSTSGPYRVEFRANKTSLVWQSVGVYGTENKAIDVAVRKKGNGAFMVRIRDNQEHVIYSA